jgi:hypothetical protein
MVNGFLTGLICGVQRLDIEGSGWVQLLVFVVLAVLYALGNMVKTKKVKPEELQEGGRAKSAIRGQSSARVEPAVVSGSAEAGETKVVSGRLKAAITQTKRLWLAELLEGLGLPVAGAMEAVRQAQTRGVKDELQPAALKAAMPVAEKVSKPKQKGEIAELPVPKPAFGGPGVVLEYGDPEELQRAILYSEILGKPLSLREPP